MKDGPRPRGARRLFTATQSVTLEIPAESGELLDKVWPDLAQAAEEPPVIGACRTRKISLGQ